MKTWISAGVVIALLVWSAAGGFALYELKRERPEDPRIEEARREAVLLRDRLEVLSADSVALAGAIERGFAGFATALEERSAADERGVQDLAARLASLEQQVQLLAQAAASRDALSAAPPPVPELEAPAAAPVVAAGPAAVEAEPAGRSFLAFSLPSKERGFEGARTWEVLGDLSRVGFDARSTLHDFTGTSSRVRGSVRVDLSRPGDGISGRIEIDARSLSTSNEGRDEAMFEHLEVERFERIAFVPTSFAVETVDAAARRVEGRVRGRMSIHGTEREIELAVRGHLDEGRRLVVEGEFPLLLSDFGVEAPNKLGLISMEDQVRVWIHLRARARLGEAAQ
jgi:polyisoprenoid-binding protein YceI